MDFFFFFFFWQNEAIAIASLKMVLKLEKELKGETSMQSPYRWFDESSPDKHQGSSNCQKQSDDDTFEASQTGLHFGKYEQSGKT